VNIKNKEKLPKCCECKHARLFLIQCLCGAIAYRNCINVWNTDKCVQLFKEQLNLSKGVNKK
jgi:hypothetical protein